MGCLSQRKGKIQVRPPETHDETSKMNIIQLLLILHLLKIIIFSLLIQYQTVTVDTLLRIRAHRLLAAKPEVKEGSAAQDRTCISILPIHTYLSIYGYSCIDRYAAIPFQPTG